MRHTILVTVPRSDLTTRYISSWAEKTITDLTSARISFIKLIKERAVGAILESIIIKQTPSLCFLNGHGGPNHVCGQDGEVLIQSGRNEGILQGMITYALSCSSAKVLGPAAVNAGATAYIGYKEDFIFFISREKMGKPLEDKTAELFLGPANYVVVALVKGHVVGEAVRKAKQHFVRNIQQLMSSEASVDEREYIRYLIWDMQHLALEGDKNAKLDS